MQKYVRVMDPFRNEYTIRTENERVEEIYHEGWKKYVELHHVQACLLTEYVDDLPVEDTRIYVTLEGMLVKMPKERLESLERADVETILTLGELLELLNKSLYTTTPIY